MSSVRRLQVMCDSKQQEWDTVHSRLTALRQAHLIETDPGNQFKLDRQIKTTEQELAIIQQELNQLEQQLAQIGGNTASPERQDYTSRRKAQAGYIKALLPGVILIFVGFLLFIYINSLFAYGMSPFSVITVTALIGGGIPFLYGIILLVKALRNS